VGFAKGGFALDMEFFSQSSTSLRTEMFNTIEKIEHTFYCDSLLQPKPIQHKIPFFVATFSTFETIEFAAKNGYGLMFSQGATLEECENAQEEYKKIAGFYPETVLMRVFSLAKTKEEAYRMAIPATEHFVKSMRAIQRNEKQPIFDKQNYEELLHQRYEFFDANKFIEAGIIGDEENCIKLIETIKRRVHNLHLVLKTASTDINETKKMLKEFSEKIKPKL
jgi:alkanesulfonate monooxygenase SsuD/methylene tetrahydromethanopterin reductase-like flavin-dependent oxidoreductase (luciferase family)